MVVKKRLLKDDRNHSEEHSDKIILVTLAKYLTYLKKLDVFVIIKGNLTKIFWKLLSMFHKFQVKSSEKHIHLADQRSQ